MHISDIAVGSLAALDVARDGQLDLVAATPQGLHGAPALVLFRQQHAHRGNKDLSTRRQVSFRVTQGNPGSFAYLRAADVDRDGADDLFGYEQPATGAPTLTFFRNTSDGQLMPLPGPSLTGEPVAGAGSALLADAILFFHIDIDTEGQSLREVKASTK